MNVKKLLHCRIIIFSTELTVACFCFSLEKKSKKKICLSFLDCSEVKRLSIKIQDFHQVHQPSENLLISIQLDAIKLMIKLAEHSQLKIKDNILALNYRWKFQHCTHLQSLYLQIICDLIQMRPTKFQTVYNHYQLILLDPNPFFTDVNLLYYKFHCCCLL